MTKQELTNMVAEILSQMHGQTQPMVKAGDYKTVLYQSDETGKEHHPGDFVPDVTQLDLRRLYLVEDAKDPETFRKMNRMTATGPSSSIRACPVTQKSAKANFPWTVAA